MFLMAISKLVALINIAATIGVSTIFNQFNDHFETKINVSIDADCGKYYKRIENVCVNISNEAISDQSQIETNCKAIGALPMVIDSSAAFYQLKVSTYDVKVILSRKCVTKDQTHLLNLGTSTQHTI